jgi:predicted DNA-binding WGR domain protein
MMIELRHIDPAKNMRRFYRLDTQPDLFGGVFLMKKWGRIGAPGRIRHRAWLRKKAARNGRGGTVVASRRPPKCEIRDRVNGVRSEP